MATKSRPLIVSLSPRALVALDEIWDWNAKRYNSQHADRYFAFLRHETNKLATDYFTGQFVPRRHNFRYIVIRRGHRGHGHLAVYEINGDVVQVLHFYHTAQNWQGRLIEDEP